MKHLIINRGLPGSGKSSYLKAIADKKTILSLDEKRMIDGKYIFDPKSEAKIKDALYCDFVEAVQNDDPIIVINNMNISKRAFKKYVDYASLNGYICSIFSFKKITVDKSFSRNTYGLSVSQITSIHEKYSPEIIVKGATNYIITSYAVAIKKLIKLGINIDNNKIAKTSNKSDGMQLNLRVKTVYQLMLQGYNSFEIVEYGLHKTDWGVGERQIRNYINKAKHIFETIVEKNRDMLLGKSVTRLEDLYRKSSELMDFKTCLAVEKVIIDMFALQKPKQVTDNDDSTPETVDFDFEEIK